MPQEIPNRFELTLAATYRARQISAGAAPLVEANRDKPTVIALREIAAGKVGIEMLKRKTRRRQPSRRCKDLAVGAHLTAMSAASPSSPEHLERTSAT